ncbi:MAG: helical backbone metal receptor, partial [Pseudomonadota bacterium]
ACDRSFPTPPGGVPPAAANRVVTLAPHLAEIVVAVGAGENLVGVSAHTDFPPEAAVLPVVGDAFALDRERLARLQPDLILAWDSGTPGDVVTGLIDEGYRVVTFPARSLADVEQSLRRIGELTGHEAAAARVAGRFAGDIAALTRPGVTPLRVFYQIGQRPLYTIGGRHYITELIERCGGRNVFADIERAAAQIALEAVIARDPELIMAAAGTDALAQWRERDALAVVRSGGLVELNADHVARPGPRLAAGGAEICAAIDQRRQALAGAQR